MFNNEDLDITQVPQVSILDTDGKNMKLDEDSEDELNEADNEHLKVPGADDDQEQEGGAGGVGNETRPMSQDSHEARIDAMLE